MNETLRKTPKFEPDLIVQRHAAQTDEGIQLPGVSVIQIEGMCSAEQALEIARAMRPEPRDG